MTNGELEETYYRITFAGMPHDTYEYGKTALDAIATVRQNEPDALGAATARPAVYGEWECDTRHYRNDGSHSHDY